MLLDRLETLQTLSRRLVLTNQLIAADAPMLVGQHEPIVTAVEDRDPDQLEAAVRAHVIEAGELLLSRMDGTAAKDGRGRLSKVGVARVDSWPTGGVAQRTAIVAAIPKGVASRPGSVPVHRRRVTLTR